MPLAIASMFVYGISADLFENLIFYPAAVRNLELWRLVTWTFATPPTFWGFLGVVFFWVFGQQLEALFGRNRFVVWIVLVTLLPALILTFLGGLSSELDFTATEFGLSSLFLGGIWVYAATYPGVRWFDIIPLWALAAIFTVLNLLQYSGVNATGKVVFLLVGVAVSLVAGRSLGLATGWPIPHIPLDGASRSSKPKKSKSSKSKPANNRVVEGPWKQGPAPVAPPIAGPSPQDQAELDSLLDKIGATGMDSLTGAEKKRLNDLSKRLRNR